MALTVAERSADSTFFFTNLSPIFIFCPFGSRFFIEAGMTAFTTDAGGDPPKGMAPNALGWIEICSKCDGLLM